MRHLKLMILATLLAAGCVRRVSPPHIIVGPLFPVIMTPLPQGADAWVCEELTGFQRCDAVIVNVQKGEFLRVVDPTTIEKLDGYFRVDQSNGLIVYWLKQ